MTYQTIYPYYINYAILDYIYLLYKQFFLSLLLFFEKICHLEGRLIKKNKDLNCRAICLWHVTFLII